MTQTMPDMSFGLNIVVTAFPIRHHFPPISPATLFIFEEKAEGPSNE